jgi:hypothetical protein
MKELIQIIQQVKELQMTERKFVLATVVQVDVDF